MKRARFTPPFFRAMAFAALVGGGPSATWAAGAPAAISARTALANSVAACAADLSAPTLTRPNSPSPAPPDLDALRAHPPVQDAVAGHTGAIRLASIRQSALSLGMRAGFDRGIWCYRQELDRRAMTLDKVYDFHALLFDAGGGFYYEPGVVTEETDNRRVSDDGRRAAAAAEHIALRTPEHLVTRARDWREYLYVETAPLAPIYAINQPRPDELARWNAWVAQGWRLGLKQAAGTMDILWNRLDRDFLGMVAYRRLVLEGKLDPPRAAVTHRAVVGNGGELRVGNVEVDTRRPGRLDPHAARWRALPFITALPGARP